MGGGEGSRRKVEGKNEKNLVFLSRKKKEMYYQPSLWEKMAWLFKEDMYYSMGKL